MRTPWSMPLLSKTSANLWINNISPYPRRFIRNAMTLRQICSLFYLHCGTSLVFLNLSANESRCCLQTSYVSSRLSFHCWLCHTCFSSFICACFYRAIFICSSCQIHPHCIIRLQGIDKSPGLVRQNRLHDKETNENTENMNRVINNISTKQRMQSLPQAKTTETKGVLQRTEGMKGQKVITMASLRLPHCQKVAVCGHSSNAVAGRWWRAVWP